MQNVILNWVLNQIGKLLLRNIIGTVSKTRIWYENNNVVLTLNFLILIFVVIYDQIFVHRRHTMKS